VIGIYSYINYAQETPWKCREGRSVLDVLMLSLLIQTSYICFLRIVFWSQVLSVQKLWTGFFLISPFSVLTWNSILWLICLYPFCAYFTALLTLELLNEWATDEWWIGKDLEGSCHDLVYVLLWHMPRVA
jgi:hypothetical protein